MLGVALGLLSAPSHVSSMLDAKMTASNGMITMKSWPQSLKCLQTVTPFTWYTKDYNIWPLPKCQVWAHISCPAPCKPAMLNCSVYSEHPTLSAFYSSACSRLCACVSNTFIHVWNLQLNATSSKKASLLLLGSYPCPFSSECVKFPQKIQCAWVFISFPFG